MSRLLFMALAGVISLTAIAAQATDPDLSPHQLYEQGELKLMPGWLPLGTDYRSAAFVQRDPARTEGHYLASWVDLELAVPEYHEKEQRYRSVREQLLLDCKGRRTGLATTALYADHFGDGAVVAVTREETPPMTEVLPGSIEDMLLKHACPVPAVHTAHRAPKRK